MRMRVYSKKHGLIIIRTIKSLSEARKYIKAGHKVVFN